MNPLNFSLDVAALRAALFNRVSFARAKRWHCGCVAWIYMATELGLNGTFGRGGNLLIAESIYENQPGW